MEARRGTGLAKASLGEGISMLFRTTILLFAAALPAFALSEETVANEFDVSSGTRLVVDVDFGNVEIVSGQDGKVAINAYRKISASDEAQEKEYFQSTPVRVSKDGNTISIRARREHGSNNWRWSGNTSTHAKYSIRAPKDLNAEVATGGGSISAADFSGSCKADTSGGDLKFARLKGPIRGNTSGGKIDMESCEGSMNIESSGGRIAATGGSGHLDLRTAGGSISVSHFAGDTRVETSGGKLFLENIRGKIVGETSGGSIVARIPSPVPADIKLETSAGRIEVVVPGDAGFDLNAETSEGSVSTDLAVVAKRAGRDGLQGTINGGGRALVLRTGAGNITIKAAGKDAP